MLNSKNKDTLVVTFSHLQERFRRFALRILPNEKMRKMLYRKLSVNCGRITTPFIRRRKLKL